MNGFKSIWIETDDERDTFFPYLFDICGVEDTHEYITNATNVDKEFLLHKIIKSNQICFLSSMIENTDSLKLLNELLATCLVLELKSKYIISAGYFLDALNNSQKIPNAGDYCQLFADNIVLELSERCFKRIIYNYEAKYYTWDATFVWENRIGNKR